MKKFKEGDIIKLVNSHHMGAKAGATGIVIGYKGIYVQIKWIRNRLSGKQCDGGYEDWVFELVKQATKQVKPYGIVAFLQGGVKWTQNQKN